MKIRIGVVALIGGALISLGGLAQEDSGQYLDSSTPGLEPQRFAIDRLIAYAYGGSFTPDLSEFFCTWQDQRGSASRIVGFERGEDSEWRSVVRLNFVATSIALEPHVSPNGQHIFYTGLRGGTWVPYVAKRTESGWSRAAPLPDTLLESGWIPMYITSTLDGTLYFTQVSASQDRIVRCSPTEDGGYSSPEPLGDGVNGSGHASHPFISPDESFLIFDSTMGEDSTGFDLYISVRATDGTWGQAQNIIELNTTGQEICASMTPDGAYLLFTRNSQIYWVDASILDPYLDSPGS